MVDSVNVIGQVEIVFHSVAHILHQSGRHHVNDLLRRTAPAMGTPASPATLAPNPPSALNFINPTPLSTGPPQEAEYRVFQTTLS